MSSVSKAQLSFAIRQHHIDWGRGTVTNGGGSPVTLRRQALAVLKELAGKPGEVVTKDELMTAVWPGIAVTDDSLVQCITEIRKALGDDEHVIIKTVPKRGYVFEAPAERIAKPKTLWPRLAAAAAAIAALALAFFAGTPADKEFAEKPAVAVLPFKKIGGDGRWDRFADAMTEDVITDLSHSRDLQVIARTSTEVYKGKAIDVRQIGRDLGVRYVLEGSVEPAGERVRATAQLIDTTTGSHVWAERYDRPATDLFAIEAEITERIAATLMGYQGIVNGAELRIAKRKPTKDLRAFDFYLLAYDAKQTLTREGLNKAEDLFKKSIAIDPDFARAYVGLAWIYTFYIYLGFTDNVAKTLGDMTAAASSAVALDPNDGEGHLALGAAMGFSGEFEKAVPEFRRAEELAPNNADVLSISGAWAPWLGQPDRGVELTERALRLNPHHPYWYVPMARDVYFWGKDFEKAIVYAKRITNPVPYDWATRAAAAAYLGRMDEARASADKLAALDSNWSVEQYVSDQGGFVRAEEADLFVNGVSKAGGRGCLTAAEVKQRPVTRRLAVCDAERAAVVAQ